MLRLSPILLTTIILVTLSYPLGVWGYLLLEKPVYSLPDSIYQSLRLYWLGSPSGDIPWQLNVARFLAAGAVFLGLLSALFILLRGLMQEFFLRFRKGHVVMAGDHPGAFALADDVLSKGKKLVLFCQDREDASLSSLKRAGAILLEGDLSDEGLLKRAGLAKAGSFLAFTEDDARNAALCLATQKIVSKRKLDSALQCHILLQDRSFLRSFREHSLLTNSLDGMDVSLFHPGDLGARLAMQKHPLEINSEGDLEEDLSLVLFQPSDLGYAYLRHALHIGHYAGGRKIEIRIVTSQPEETELRLADQFPGLGEIAEMRVIESPNDSPTSLAKAFLDTSPSPSHWHTLVCGLAEDEANLGLSQTLQLTFRELRCQILCVISQHEELASLISTTSKKGLPTVEAIPMGTSLLNWEQVVCPNIDDQARFIHSDYIAVQKESEKFDPTNPSHRAWENLGEVYKIQNRLQADHIAIKLRAAGLDPKNLPAQDRVAACLETQVEKLAAMEHARWNAANFLAGWTFAPGDKDDSLKTSPYLVPWGDLSEEIRDYDRDAVRNIPSLLYPSKDDANS